MDVKHVIISKELHKVLKAEAQRTGMKVQAIAERAINRYLSRRQRKSAQERV